MKCTNCGNNITDDSIFCEFCGTKVAKIENQEEYKVPVSLLLSVVAFLLCAANIVYYYAFYLEAVTDQWHATNPCNYWIFIPILSFIIFILSVTLSLKLKKLFVSVFFLISCLNMIIVVEANSLNYYLDYRAEVAIRNNTTNCLHYLYSGSYNTQDEIDNTIEDLKKIISPKYPITITNNYIDFENEKANKPKTEYSIYLKQKRIMDYLYPSNIELDVTIGSICAMLLLLIINIIAIKKRKS